MLDTIGEPQTLGMSLNALLPTVFPSRRTAIHARPILHGAPVPLSAPLEELVREAAYPDGWIHLSFEMIG
jgi:autophagy-related protein 5